jgi:glucose/arabinose dehydrogenase
MLALGLALAFGLSACQKSQESQVSSTDENPATATETPAVTEPPAAPTPEPAPAETPATAPTKAPAKTTSKSTTKTTTAAAAAATSNSVTLPAGTEFEVTLTTPVDTRTSNVGDKIEGTLVAPLMADGHTIAEAGAVLRGEISDLQRASRAKSEEDRASVKFAFTSIQTVDGEKTLAATVTNAEGKMVAKSTGTRDKLIIGGSTIAGAIVGKIAGKDTKGAILGAVGGAVLGTGAVLAAKGYELEVPAGSKVSLRAEAPITVVSK